MMIVTTAANRPAAGIPGRVHLAADTGAMSFDTGQGWIAVAPGAVGLPVVGSLAASYATTSTSTTGVSAGWGLPLTPTASRVWIHGIVYISSNTSGAGAHNWVFRSTVGIPAAGTVPPSGDVIVWGQPFDAISPAANQEVSLPVDFVDTGLTAGTTYYYYHSFAIAVSISSTATVIGNANPSLASSLIGHVLSS
jgi:hypothetical protein